MTIRQHWLRRLQRQQSVTASLTEQLLASFTADRMRVFDALYLDEYYDERVISPVHGWRAHLNQFGFPVQSMVRTVTLVNGGSYSNVHLTVQAIDYKSHMVSKYLTYAHSSSTSAPNAFTYSVPGLIPSLILLAEELRASHVLKAPEAHMLYLDGWTSLEAEVIHDTVNWKKRTQEAGYAYHRKDLWRIIRESYKTRLEEQFAKKRI